MAISLAAVTLNPVGATGASDFVFTVTWLDQRLTSSSDRHAATA